MCFIARSESSLPHYVTLLLRVHWLSGGGVTGLYRHLLDTVGKYVLGPTSSLQGLWNKSELKN